MLTKAVDLANAAGKSRAYISQETKRGHLVRDIDGKYDTENPLNRNWIVAKGIKSSDLGSGIKIIKNQVLPAAVKKPKTKVKPKPSKNKTPIKKDTPKKSVPKPEKTEQKKSNKKPKKQTPKVKNKSKKSESNKKPDKKKPVKPDTNEIIAPASDDLPDTNIDSYTEQKKEELLAIPEKLRTMTLEQIVFSHMNIAGLKTYAETIDKIMSGFKKSVEIQRMKHELINRDFFRSHIIVYLDVMNDQLFDMAGTDKKMLKDFSKVIKHAKISIKNELDKIIKIQQAASGK